MINLKDDKNKFEWGVILSRFGLLATLTTMSYINADVSFISTKPRDFLEEALLVGGTSFIAVSILAYNRDAELKKILNASIVVFFVFFIFHILMELSGFNNLTALEIKNSDNNITNTINNIILSSKTVWPTLIISGGIMWSLAYKISEFGQYRRKGFKNSALECLLFGTINAAPTYIISKNRGANNNTALIETSKMTFIYGIGYILLEAGGYFTNTLYEEAKTKLKLI